MIRHCRLYRALKVTSPMCPLPLGPPAIQNDTTSSPEDPDDPPPSMETIWRSMNETKLEVEEAKHEAEETKHKVEEEIKEREKSDIGDTVKKIQEYVAVKAAEQYRQEREQKDEN